MLNSSKAFLIIIIIIMKLLKKKHYNQDILTIEKNKPKQNKNFSESKGALNDNNLSKIYKKHKGVNNIFGNKINNNTFEFIVKYLMLISVFFLPISNNKINSFIYKMSNITLKIKGKGHKKIFCEDPDFFPTQYIQMKYI